MKTVLLELLGVLLMSLLFNTAQAQALPQTLPPHPRLLLDASDVKALKQRIAQKSWDVQWRDFKAGVDKTLAVAVELPPRGGNWSHNYVCPQHGARLKRGRQLGPWEWEHHCPIGDHVLRGNPTKANLDFDGNAIMEVHGSFGRQLVNLGVVYQVTGEPHYAAKAREILLAYADKYLSYALHDNQGRPKSGGRVASQSLTEASWLITMAQGADLIWDTLSDEQHSTVAEKLFRPALEQIILPSKLGIHNIQCRHNAAIGLVGYLLGDNKLVHIALDDPARGFRQQIQKGVREDGMWLEGASGYHFFTIDGLWPLSEAARHCGVDLYDARYKSMFDGPLALAMPNLMLPNFNDSGFVALASQAPLYELAFARWKDPHYVPLITAGGRKSDLALWYGAPQLTTGAAVATQSSRNSPASGYAILERKTSKGAEGPDGGSTWLCVKYGPHGGGHGHYDKNHFILYGRGGVLMPDAGTHAYGSPLHGTWDKTTLAHNTLVMDEQSQSAAEGRSLAFGQSGPADYSITDAGAIYPGVRFVRTVALLNDNVAVFVDQVSADKEHLFDLAAHFTGQWKGIEGTTWTLPAAPNYQHITSATQRSSATGWNGVVVNGAKSDTTNDNGVTVIALAGGVTTQIITGNGIGASTQDLVPILLVRRTARETAFVWAVTLDGKPASLETYNVQSIEGQTLVASIATAVIVRSAGKYWALLINPEKRAVTVQLPGGLWSSHEAFAVRETR